MSRSTPQRGDQGLVAATHILACESCLSLMTFAFENHDGDAIRAWGEQMEAHVAAERERDEGGFTTLAVPLFFVLLYAIALASGLPVALLAAPVVFRLALLIVPPPSRLRLPTCPHLIRHDALRATRLAEPQRRPPPVFDPKSAPIFDPKHGGIVWHGRLFMPDATRPGTYLQARRSPAPVLVFPPRDETRESQGIAAA